MVITSLLINGRMKINLTQINFFIIAFVYFIIRSRQPIRKYTTFNFLQMVTPTFNTL